MKLIKIYDFEHMGLSKGIFKVQKYICCWRALEERKSRKKICEKIQFFKTGISYSDLLVKRYVFKHTGLSKDIFQL